MAARFCKVACLWVSSSLSNSVRVVDVMLETFFNQHSTWANSPRAFAAATHGSKMLAATLFEKDHWTILSSQFEFNVWVALLDRIVEFLRLPIISSFAGEYNDSSPKEHGPPSALAGMPGHAQSPQIRKMPGGSFLGRRREGPVREWEALRHHLGP